MNLLTTPRKQSTLISLPPADEMYEAVCRRDSQYEGVFFVGVRTTGIFCRPTCSARKPNRENVDFYGNTRDALAAGLRPCRRCKPLEVFGQSPDWLDALLAVVEQHPDRRWTDADLRAMNYQPSRIRRWFKQNHGMTFQTYIRTRRLAAAMGQIRQGENSTRVALANGFDSLSGFSEAFKNWYGLSPGNSKTSGDPIWVDRLLTPLGPMIAAAVDEGLCLLEFADRRMLETQFKRLHRIYGRPLAPGKHRIIAQAADELTDYFAGRRSRFDVPLALEGTDFQMAVWRRLLEIPFGSTTSYESLANLIMRPGAQRAVGRANGDNRLAIIVPCHRVVRSDGSLCGYGGGIWRKQWLLDHEKSGE